MTLSAKFVWAEDATATTVLGAFLKLLFNFWHIKAAFSFPKMSQQAGYSPSFKRPAETMRMRSKRARSDAGIFGSSGRESTSSPREGDSSPACVRPFSPGPLFNAQNRSGGGTKRRNPFANIENTYSPKKKFVIYNEDDGKAEVLSPHSEHKEGEDASTRTQSPAVLSFTASLTKAEKQEQRHISTKVGCKYKILT